MAMPQRDNTIEAIKRLEPPSRVRYGAPGALLEYAVMHGDEEEAERLREELRKMTESARLATLRDSLLPLLMNGQVKIR